MLDKIKNWNPWIIAIFIAIGIEAIFSLVSTVLSVDIRGFLREIGLVFALPALKITGYETVQAINNFSGDPADVSRFSELAISTGISVFIIFILGPYLLLKGYTEADTSKDSRSRSWKWYTGAILIILALVPAVIGATVGTVVHLNTGESVEDNRQRDLLRTELADLAYDASYKMFVSQEMGGGEGSFNTFGEQSEPLSLENLDSYQSESEFDFQINGEIRDSVVTIVGVSSRTGKDESFENVNGEIGKQQISVTVTPYEEDIFKMNSKNSLDN